MIYHLVNKQFAIENGIEIVDLPIKACKNDSNHEPAPRLTLLNLR